LSQREIELFEQMSVAFLYANQFRFFIKEVIGNERAFPVSLCDPLRQQGGFAEARLGPNHKSAG